MKPPICALCDQRFDPADGGLVRFAPTPASEAWRARAAAEPGFVGHPPDVVWFCSAHRAAAESLADRPLAEALRAMRESTTAVIERAAEYARSLGVEPLPDLVASTARRWSPMDGCLPPYCPYVDEQVFDGSNERGRVRITRTDAWWNDKELANTSTSVSVWSPDGRHLGTIDVR